MPPSDDNILVHKFMIDQLNNNMVGLQKEVRGYKAETQEHRIQGERFYARLDDHIATCDRRYQEMKDNRESPAGSALVRKSWMKRKIEDKAFDYVAFLFLFLIYFAIEHGALKAIPPPATPSTLGPP